MEIKVTFTNAIETTETRESRPYELPDFSLRKDLPEFWSFAEFVSYVKNQMPCDERINTFTERFCEKMDRKKQLAKFRKEKQNNAIIYHIKESIRCALELGETTTALTVRDYVKNKASEILLKIDNYTISPDKVTLPKVEKALEELLKEDILELTIDKPDGYRNYVKCYTRVN